MLHWNVIYKQNRGCNGLVKVDFALASTEKRAREIAAKSNGFDESQITKCYISVL